jgi:hypothetical protein
VVVTRVLLAALLLAVTALRVLGVGTALELSAQLFDVQKARQGKDY